MESLCVVIPVYNDWTSFEILLDKLDAVAANLAISITVLGVDDGSTEPEPDWRTTPGSPARWQTLKDVRLVQLAANVGHQRAIAIGLCVALADHDPDAVLVMDGDGEDPPEQIGELVRRAEGKRDFCIVAQRRRRTESVTFKMSYVVYKAVFRLVTGKAISFGNFSLTSRSYARRLVMIPDLWNNLAAGLLRSKLPVQRVPIDRGHRYAGKSKMNFVSLVVHGLSGISVYADTIYVRLLLLTVAVVALTILSIPSLLILRIFYPMHATPGWATTVSFGLIIIFLQVFLTTLSSILMILNNRVQRLVLPFVDYKPYVLETRSLRTPSSDLSVVV
jgi:glycosyltransferase involved in cell wall biosynthesis